MNGAWDAQDEKEMNALAKDTLKRQSAITDAEVKSQLIKAAEAQAAPAADKTALQLSMQLSNLELNDIQKQGKPEKDLSLENPLPNPLMKPLTKTNQDNTHDIHDPWQRITPIRQGNYFGQISDDGDDKPSWAERRRTAYDPLEHTHYGENEERSTHDNPLPYHLTAPLVITNKNDSHDFKMPYKDWNQIKLQEAEQRAEREEEASQGAAAAGVVAAQRGASHTQLSSRSVGADGVLATQSNAYTDYGKYEMANMLNAKGITDEYTKYVAPPTGLASTDSSASEIPAMSSDSLQRRGPARTRGTEASPGLIGGRTDDSAEEQQDSSLTKASTAST